MTRGYACLHSASSRILVGHGVGRDLHYLCKPLACSTFQSRRGVTRTPGGAYGVVGFSGVKDARRAYLSADALRRLLEAPEGYRSTTWRLQRACKNHLTGQILDKLWTNTGQIGVQVVCIYWAISVRSVSI
jgi:hypothetical protein